MTPLEVLESDAREIARMLKGGLPRDVIFFLWLANEDFSTYMSNGNRSDMVLALRELADKLESGTDAPHGAL